MYIYIIMLVSRSVLVSRSTSDSVWRNKKEMVRKNIQQESKYHKLRWAQQSGTSENLNCLPHRPLQKLIIRYRILDPLQQPQMEEERNHSFCSEQQRSNLVPGAIRSVVQLRYRQGDYRRKPVNLLEPLVLPRRFRRSMSTATFRGGIGTQHSCLINTWISQPSRLSRDYNS